MKIFPSLHFYNFETCTTKSCSNRRLREEKNYKLQFKQIPVQSFLIKTHSTKKNLIITADNNSKAKANTNRSIAMDGVSKVDSSGVGITLWLAAALGPDRPTRLSL